MRDRIESLEDKIMSAASDDQKVAEKEEKAGPSEVLQNGLLPIMSRL